tara:strand:+ start:441 stop:761 length:321 start_codon:yes stop_codon:yes gene_type:complete
MSLFGWLKMNLFFDIALVVFSVAVIWKFVKMQKSINSSKEEIINLNEKVLLHKAFMKQLSEKLNLQAQAIYELGSDVALTMRNPQEARRVYKQREKEMQENESKSV